MDPSETSPGEIKMLTKIKKEIQAVVDECSTEIRLKMHIL